MNNKTKQHENVLRTVTLAVFVALAYALVCTFRIKVSFLTFDVKDAVITVAAMIFGPLSAVAMSLAVSFVEMITISDTQLYGFIMNVLSTLSLSVTASLIYKYKRSMLGAALGLISGVFAVTSVMMLANLFITPYYMGVDRAVVVNLIPKLLLPFNFTKATLNAAITLLIYKPIVTAMRRAGVIKSSGSVKSTKTMLFVTAIAVGVIAAAVVMKLILRILQAIQTKLDTSRAK